MGRLFFSAETVKLLGVTRPNREFTHDYCWLSHSTKMTGATPIPRASFQVGQPVTSAGIDLAPGEVLITLISRAY